MEVYDQDGNRLDSESVPNEFSEQEQQSGNEIPEQGEADNEKQGYPHQQEVQQYDNGNDASYTEQTDVTPPSQHEFPSEGRAMTDFTPGNHGRSTGRIVGHEPGTEGI